MPSPINWIPPCSGASATGSGARFRVVFNISEVQLLVISRTSAIPLPDFCLWVFCPAGNPGATAHMKKIGIIGVGFCGTMLAAHLVRGASKPVKLILFDHKTKWNRGVAYRTYSERHLLNVVAGKMSAFADAPDHFLDWAQKQPHFQGIKREILSGAFLPRNLYGAYLDELWQETKALASRKQIVIEAVYDQVVNLDRKQTGFELQLAGMQPVEVDICVLATGNQLPANPELPDSSFTLDQRYCRDPWSSESIRIPDSDLPILIVGNGLTMVDTVTGLIEHGVKNRIVSLSTHGFNILPHRHSGLQYNHLRQEIRDGMSLRELVALFNRHIKKVRQLGISAEPVVDSIRPLSRQLWQQFTDAEKQLFMSRIRHLWGVARHRVPLHLHDKIQQLRVERRLQIFAGHLLNIEAKPENMTVEYWDRKRKKTSVIEVSRIINCTGPQTDLSRMDEGLLRRCWSKGLLSQDKLRLGVEANPETYTVIDRYGVPVRSLCTLGSNLKGIFWESTAVNELRSQAWQLAQTIEQEI